MENLINIIENLKTSKSLLEIDEATKNAVKFLSNPKIMTTERLEVENAISKKVDQILRQSTILISKTNNLIAKSETKRMIKFGIISFKG